MDARLLEVLQEQLKEYEKSNHQSRQLTIPNLGNMSVHTRLWLDIALLRGWLQLLVDPGVSVESLHQPTDVDAGILGC